jgi:NAD(P)H-dependent flavin oxidoreductase YrpB (nitropropane dioxygenase family)
VTLPANARVRAAASFARNLDEARRFLMEQDASSAPERFRKLQLKLQDAHTLLSSSPTSGRPARFLATASVQGRLQAQRALQLAARAGLPQLRELVIARYVLLYAHSDSDVMLLALKHERQLTYQVQPGAN